MSLFLNLTSPIKVRSLINHSRGWSVIVRKFRNIMKWGLKGRNTFGDRIIIEDEVEVWNGKTHFKSRGHIVNQGLILNINLMAIAQVSAITQMPSYGWTGISTGRMRLGTNTTTVTTAGMTALVAEIATNPNSQAGATSNPASGQYRVAWTATWNAGTISGTIGEMGLFLYMNVTLQSFGAIGVGATTFQLFSRLSVADGDFTAFTINTAVPLTIEWRLTVTFA